MVKKLQRVLFALLLLCVVYAALMLQRNDTTSRQEPEEALDGGKWRIVAIIPDTGGADGRNIRQEMEIAGASYGAYIEFYETASAVEQRSVLQIAVDSGADGVILYPMEKSGYTADLAACEGRGIPVVVISQRLENARFDTFIGSAGNSERMAVLSCVSAVNGEGRLLIVDHLNAGGHFYTEAAMLVPAAEAPAPSGDEDFPALQTKISGLVSAPFEGYRVENVTVLDETHASSYSLYTEVYKLLTSWQPDAVFSYDRDVTNVIAACLTNSNNLEMYAVGYGDPRECAEQLRDGTLNGLVVQYDSYAASTAVRYLAELCKGSYMPPVVDSGLILITENNMERVLGENEL